jgi:general secretion pathway protein G
MVRSFAFLTLLSCVASLGCANPANKRRTLLQKEHELRQNLDTLRKTIDAYTYDKRKAPQSLEDLVSVGYLKKIPVDPMTYQADWKTVTESSTPSIDQTEPGIDDVHSASTLVSSEGTPYNTW